MSRSTRLKGTYEKDSEVPQEGTAARTRPFSFNETMSKRKNKMKLFEHEREGVVEDVLGDGKAEKVSDRLKKDDSRGKDSSNCGLSRFSEEEAKVRSRKKEESISLKDDYLAKSIDREIRHSETKLRSKIEIDVKAKGKTDEKIDGRKKRDEPRSNIVVNEALNKHSRDLTERDRHVDGSWGKSERENKRKYHSGIDEKKRERYPTRNQDIRKGHDSENLDRKDRKERKELSKSRNEETNLKRRRSRSREHVDKKRTSISPLPRSQKHSSYHGKDHGEPSSSLKGRSGRQHYDVDKSKLMNNGSSGYSKRHGGSTSGLGGYSPRKRRSEAAAKTPSPTKHSPENKSAKWDLAPKGAESAISVSVPSNFELSKQPASTNIHEAVSFVPVALTMVKPSLGVAFNTLSTNNNDSIDSIQLTQATRPMRRLYVDNIPASASEKAVMEFLNNVLISSGVNHIRGTQPCISCIINKEKGQALVEFLTPEDALAALSLDGSSFSGSIIKIRRPKDFVEVATGDVEKSVPAVNAVSNIVKDSPHKIFIGGISKALSSKMIMEIASAFGPLKAFHFENGDDLNEPCAFLEYADQSVTFKACAGLNGMKLGGQIITAVQVFPNVSILESSGNTAFYGIPEHAKPLLKKPTQVLKLNNVFDPEALPSLSRSEIEEVVEDVRLECSRFGTVKSVNVVEYSTAPISTSRACGLNEETKSAGSQQNLVCRETNAETETIKETDHKIAEGNGTEDGIPAGDVMEHESCQPGQFDSSIAVENLSGKSGLKSLEQTQETLKDDLDCTNDKAIDNNRMKDTIVEDVLPIIEELKLEEVSGKVQGSFMDEHIIGSGANQKVEYKEQNCDLSHIFEPGSVFVEFRRTEASQMAAHCLHGRLFDNRAVMVGYVPLDVYQARFPK